MIHARKDYDRIQDPLEKIGKDEPVFLIRAKDRVSADAVRSWASLNWIAGGDIELSRIAIAHACDMEAWQRRNGSKLAGL